MGEGWIKLSKKKNVMKFFDNPYFVFNTHKTSVRNLDLGQVA